MGQTIFELLKTIESEPRARQSGTTGMLMGGVVIGRLATCDGNGQVKVTFDAGSVDAPVLAQSVVTFLATDVGRRVCLMFEQGNLAKPIIMGVLQDRTLISFPTEAGPGSYMAPQVIPIEAKVDGEQVVIEGKKEIVLRCGKASITLTRAGKVLIRGVYVLSRSSGLNRVKGGSVQIN